MKASSMFDIIYSAMQQYGFWPIISGIWSVICLVIKSIVSGTDIMSEYKSLCDAQTKRMNDLFLAHLSSKSDLTYSNDTTPISSESSLDKQ